MTPRSIRLSVSVALSLAIAAAATGCEIIANFDRSLIPAEGGAEDAAAYDAQYPDGNEDSATPGVDGGQDATVADASSDAPTSTDAPHLGADAGDANVIDSSVADASMPDATDATASEEDSSSEDAASDDGG